MKQFKKYMVYMEDDGLCFRRAVPAVSKKAAEEFVNGMHFGRVVSIEDVTEKFPISSIKVKDALRSSHFGDSEIDFILFALSFTGITD